MPKQIITKKENPILMKNINIDKSDMNNYEENQTQVNSNKTISKKNVGALKSEISSENNTNAFRAAKKNITIEEKNRYHFYSKI
jgi:hypothetical protein